MSRGVRVAESKKMGSRVPLNLSFFGVIRVLALGKLVENE